MATNSAPPWNVFRKVPLNPKTFLQPIMKHFLNKLKSNTKSLKNWYTDGRINVKYKIKPSFSICSNQLSLIRPELCTVLDKVTLNVFKAFTSFYNIFGELLLISTYPSKHSKFLCTKFKSQPNFLIKLMCNPFKDCLTIFTWPVTWMIHYTCFNNKYYLILEHAFIQSPNTSIFRPNINFFLLRLYKFHIKSVTYNIFLDYWPTLFATNKPHSYLKLNISAITRRVIT